MSRLVSLSLAFAVALMALAGSAQAVTVGVEARHFVGTGLGGSPFSPNPCCGPGGTFDTRTTGHVVTPTNMSVAVPRGAPFYTELDLDGGALPPISNDRVYRSVDVDSANGALNIASGRFGFETLAERPPFGAFTFFLSARTTNFASAMLAPGGGPGTFNYTMANNGYTTSNQNQIVNTNGGGGATTTSTTTSTVMYNLQGRASGTAGENQFGGTWSIIGRSLILFNRPGAGVGIEVQNPIPWGPGTIQPNGPSVRRTVDTAFNFIHAGDINGPIINTVSGPIILDALPLTTGMITANNTSFLTPTSAFLEYADREETGVDTRTTTNYLNGNLQLVQPMMATSFAEGNPADGGSTIWTRRWNLNFVPEPSSLALIGAGTLALIGFAGARKRS